MYNNKCQQPLYLLWQRLFIIMERIYCESWKWEHAFASSLNIYTHTSTFLTTTKCQCPKGMSFAMPLIEFTLSFLKWLRLSAYSVFIFEKKIKIFNITTSMLSFYSSHYHILNILFITGNKKKFDFSALCLSGFYMKI